jgi:hypothetical protein
MHRLVWSKKRPKYVRPDKGHYSISSKLRSENKTNDEFEVMVASLTLEEIIALKLEISARAVNHKLYGFDLWKKIPAIAKEAVFNYAYSGTRTKNELAAFLGISMGSVERLLQRNRVADFFKRS